MPHYKAYDSFKTKKSIYKKNKAKEKSFDKETTDDLFIDSSSDFGIVLEVRYNDSSVIYKGEIVSSKLRKDINMICNQVLFPGDKVKLIKKDDTYIIQNILYRSTLLSRVKKDSTRISDFNKLTKNIAANINLAVIVVSSKEPPLHPKFIDRYLIVLQNSGIESIICLNKSDLKTEEEDIIINIYKELGIPVIETSTYNNAGIDELKEHLRGKDAIFVGNSGVGKSSLINAIVNDEEIKTSSVSEKSKRGRHTTTTSKYYVWEENSSIIDTPGIRSLDVSSFKPIEIQEYFFELNNMKEKCKYNDCLHYNEPYESCAVKQAVESNTINQNRYESYLRIMSNILNESDYEYILAEFLDNTSLTSLSNRKQKI